MTSMASGVGTLPSSRSASPPTALEAGLLPPSCETIAPLPANRLTATQNMGCNSANKIPINSLNSLNLP